MTPATDLITYPYSPWWWVATVLPPLVVVVVWAWDRYMARREAQRHAETQKEPEGT